MMQERYRSGLRSARALLLALGLSASALVPVVVSVGCTDAGQTETPPSARPPVLLTAEVDKSEGTTGDVIRYTVTLDRQPDIDVAMPEVFSKIEGFKVADIKSEGPVTRDGRVVQKKIFELRADEVGSYILPEVKATYKDDRGQPQTAGAPQIFVEIKTVLQQGEDKDDIADIKPMEQPKIDYRRLGLIVGAVVAGLALVGGLIYYLRRRRKLEGLLPPPLPPWELALQELSALESLGLLAAGDARSHCYQLSEIFRRYLERRFDFPALEETTEEILNAFRKTAVPQGRPRDLARRVLTGTDQVKYARQVPSAPEAEEMLQSARSFIEATVPPPPVPESDLPGKEVR